MRKKLLTLAAAFALLWGCASDQTTRYTSEIVWPSDPQKNRPALIVLEWPLGVTMEGVRVTTEDGHLMMATPVPTHDDGGTTVTKTK
jgi:uncharacterized lipoprotein YajG